MNPFECLAVAESLEAGAVLACRTQHSVISSTLHSTEFNTAASTPQAARFPLYNTRSFGQRGHCVSIYRPYHGRVIGAHLKTTIRLDLQFSIVHLLKRCLAVDVSIHARNHCLGAHIRGRCASSAFDPLTCKRKTNPEGIWTTMSHILSAFLLSLSEVMAFICTSPERAHCAQSTLVPTPPNTAQYCGTMIASRLTEVLPA